MIHTLLLVGRVIHYGNVQARAGGVGHARKRREINRRYFWEERRGAV